MHQKRLAAGLRSDPLGELKCSPRAPIRSGKENYNLYSRSFVPIAGKGREKWKCVELAEMNEKGYFKPCIVSHFNFRSKCLFCSELRKEIIERA